MDRKQSKNDVATARREIGISDSHSEIIRKMWGDVQVIFEDLFDVESLVLWIVDDDGNMINPLPYKVEKAVMDDYLAEAYSYDPLNLVNLPGDPQKTIVRIEDLISQQGYYKTDYYSKYAGKYSIDEHMARLLIYYDDKLIGFIGIASKSEIDDENIRQLQHFAPFLGNIMMLNHVGQRLRSENRLLNAFIAGSESGMIMLDEDNHITQINRAACDLRSKYAWDTTTLETFAKGLTDRKSAISIKLQMLGYDVNVSTQHGSSYSKEGTKAIIIRRIGEDKSDDDTAMLLNKLTTTELLVCSDLCEGLTYKDIAEKNHMSIGSVNKHASNIYEKCYVDNRNVLQAVLKTK